MEHAFAGVDKMIRGTFLPRLSKENTRQKGVPNHFLYSRERVSCVPGDTL